MNFDFSDDQQAIKRTAKDLLAARFTADRLRELAEGRTYDDAAWKELCELGWPGIFVPEDSGGQGLGIVELVILMEELGYALAPLPFLSTVSAGLALEVAGSDEQRERWLPGIASGELRATAGLETNGEGKLVPDAEGAELIVLLGREGGRVLEAGQAEVEPLETIDATRRFARVRGDGGEALPGDTSAALDRIVTGLSAELTGVAQRAMEMAVEYARDRKQFGRPIGAYQAVAHRCAQMLLETEGARSASYYAGWTADAEPRVAAAGGLDGQGLRLGRRLAGHRIVATGARRHRVHLGARPALLPEARQGGRDPVRLGGLAPGARGRAVRAGGRARPRLTAACSR